MSKITIETTIDRRYLRNRTKDEIIEHVMRSFDEIDRLTAALSAKGNALDQAIEATGLRPYGEYLLSAHPSARGCIDIADAPELAAELKLRSRVGAEVERRSKA